jgi:DNA-binding MarR family transcriptional regulator
MQTFISVAEMDEAIRCHKRNNQLNKTEIAVLDVLARFSCKEIGKSFLAKNTIAKLIGKSRRTVIRACNRLESLGIIRQYERKRTTGDRRQTSNLIVILPAEETLVTPACHTEETPQRNLNNNTYKETEESANSLRRSIPAPIYNAFAPYFNADDLYNVVGVLYRAKASVDRSITVEDFAQEFIDAFKTVVFKYKRGRVRSLAGYLFVTWRQVAIEIKRRMTLASSDIYYDWLA